MQLSITKRAKALILVAILGVGVWVTWVFKPTAKNNFTALSSKLSKLENQNSLGRSIAGKSMTAFRADYTFDWINQEQGIGRVRVELQSRSFVAQSWNYQWVLPPEAVTQETITATFDSPHFRETQVFELEVAGLDSTISQNIFLKVKPVMREDSAMTIVIPTLSEQTAESSVRQASLKSLKVQAVRKSLASPQKGLGKSDEHHHTHRLQF